MSRAMTRSISRSNPSPRVLAILLFALVPLVALASSPSAAGTEAASPEVQVVSVVEQFLDALGRRDVVVTRKLLVDQGHFYRVRGEGVDTEMRISTHEQFFERLGQGDGTFTERIWEPEVLVHGSIATVWAPYDFHIDGERSHCGVNAFHLVRTKDGWRIATTLYTVEPDGCGESPLGPVQAPAPPE